MEDVEEVLNIKIFVLMKFGFQIVQSRRSGYFEYPGPEQVISLLEKETRASRKSLAGISHHELGFVYMSVLLPE